MVNREEDKEAALPRKTSPLVVPRVQSVRVAGKAPCLPSKIHPAYRTCSSEVQGNEFSQGASSPVETGA